MSKADIKRSIKDAQDAQPHLLKVADAISVLLAPYSAVDRQTILAQLTEERKSYGPVAPKAGDVLGAIVRLIPQDRTWTIEELKQSVNEKRVNASAKEVYNAIGYLKRRGHVKRVAYGRYIVDGIEFVTTDDFGCENVRHEDEYRVDRNGE